MATFRYLKRRVLRSPIMVNLEVTSGCNLRCRHCYNFWRDEKSSPVAKLSLSQADQLIDHIVEAKVFHVVLTGGEPMMNMPVLEHMLCRFQELGVSTSLNSNLMLATEERVGRLTHAGLDHVLTSLDAADPAINDHMMNKKGALNRVVEGIKTARRGGLRVSANMIVSDQNRDQIPATAALAADLEVQRLFVTRLVPSVRADMSSRDDLRFSREAALETLDRALDARHRYGIATGTLVAYPLCLLGDLERFEEFVGRGCPAQRGNRMCIGADGQTHACTHEEQGYGNVFEEGIGKPFSKMRSWHDGSFLWEECESCRYINLCQSGCRSAAFSATGAFAGKDPLSRPDASFSKHYALPIPEQVRRAIQKGAPLSVPKTIRFREEEGFYTVNVRWANAFSVDTDLALWLRDKQKGGEPFAPSETPWREETLVRLLFKEAIEPAEADLKACFAAGVKLGCSVDPDGLLEESSP